MKKLLVNAAISVIVAEVVQHIWPDATVSIGYFIAFSLMVQLGRER